MSSPRKSSPSRSRLVRCQKYRLSNSSAVTSCRPCSSTFGLRTLGTTDGSASSAGLAYGGGGIGGDWSGQYVQSIRCSVSAAVSSAWWRWGRYDVMLLSHPSVLCPLRRAPCGAHCSIQADRLTILHLIHFDHHHHRPPKPHVKRGEDRNMVRKDLAAVPPCRFVRGRLSEGIYTAMCEI
jgi:hypothetical protein